MPLGYQRKINDESEATQTLVKGAYQQAVSQLGLSTAATRQDGNVERIVDTMYGIIDKELGIEGDDLQKENKRRETGLSKVNFMETLKYFREQSGVSGLDVNRADDIAGQLASVHRKQQENVVYAKFGRRDDEGATEKAFSDLGLKYNSKTALPDERKADIKRATVLMTELEKNSNIDLEDRLAA